MMSKTTEELAKAFKEKTEVADISDALDEIVGIKNPFVMHEVYPQTVKNTSMFPVAGIAITVNCLPQRVYRKMKFDNLLKAVEMAKQGDVLVFGMGRAHVLTVGLNMCTGFRQRGIEAVVTDGGARDITDTKELGFPVFARTITPLSSARGRIEFTDINVPINCGGVQVVPGDIIVGDEDGVVVVPQDIAPDVFKLAEKHREYSNMIQEEMTVRKTPWTKARIIVSEKVGTKRVK